MGDWEGGVRLHPGLLPSKEAGGCQPQEDFRLIPGAVLKANDNIIKAPTMKNIPYKILKLEISWTL